MASLPIHPSSHASFITIYFFLMLLGCQQTDTESGLSYAHVPYSEGGPQFLINVGPKETLCVSGSEASLVIKAIKRWAKLIDREALKVVDCGEVTDEDKRVTISTSNCDGVAFAIPERRQISLCRDLATAGASKESIILHEVGHLWGLCDLYEPAYSSCDDPNSDIFLGLLGKNHHFNEY
jgi:hypothetical protein